MYSYVHRLYFSILHCWVFNIFEQYRYATVENDWWWIELIYCDASIGMVYSYYIKIVYSPLLKLKFL